MGDVDKLQVAEEAAAQRAEAKAAKRRERDAEELRAEPLRTTATRSRTATALALAQVHPGENIRLDLPEIQELALSIREVGLLTPLLVRPWETDRSADGPLPETADPTLDQYRLVAGHRRHAALTALADAGVDEFGEVACEVREGLSEAEAYALMLTENVQRVPLEPMQAARALRLLLDLNPELDAASLARSLGLRPGWATTHLKLLDLPREVLDRLEDGDLSVTIADLLRRGQSTGRIDEAKVKDLAAKVASGEITTAQVRKEAGPPPKPNTVAPRTVATGPDGRPLEESATWQSLGAASAKGEDFARPATPLTGDARQNPYSSGDALTPARAAASAQDAPIGSAPVVPYEDRLDAYLLGRALEQWATDDYLDEIGIDRVQAASYAAMLGFEERIAAIRHLSATLMEADAAAGTLVGSR
ncbi:MAG: ParB domain protein nuclease [Thermoleophilia bacterium]|nr:ParB domain protein nuclease [Thermoleophilia bacterium]